MPAVVDDDKTKAAAEKQLQTMLGATSSLVGKDYHSFKKKLDRFALAYEWPTHILDPEEQLDADAEDNLTVKQKMDVRNAYLLITQKTDGHPVENVLESCDIGDAQEAFKLLQEFFHPKTQGGRKVASKTFWQATMSNTGTNIVEWSALVTRQAKVAK